MHSEETQEQFVDKQAGFVGEDDEYPTAVRAMQRIIGEGALPDGPIGRFEMRVLASGEVTYRVWAPRAEEPEGGYLPAESSS